MSWRVGEEKGIWKMCRRWGISGLGEDRNRCKGGLFFLSMFFFKSLVGWEGAISGCILGRRKVSAEFRDGV